MNTAYDKLRMHLTEMNLGFWSNDNEQAVCVDFPGIVGSYRLFAKVNNEVGQFQVTGQLRLSVAEGCRPAVTEVVQCANERQIGGEFEIDFDKCELRFQVSEVLLGDDLENETVEHLISATIRMLDAYLPAILSVIYGNELPKDAIQQVHVAE